MLKGERKIENVQFDRMVKFQDELWWVYKCDAKFTTVTLKKVSPKRHFKAVAWGTVVRPV